MLIFEAFNLSAIQDCLHLLNECEAVGAVDIRFARQRLAQSMSGRAGTEALPRTVWLFQPVPLVQTNSPRPESRPRQRSG